MDEMMKKMGFGENSKGGWGHSDEALLAELGGPSNKNPKSSGIDDLMN